MLSQTAAGVATVRGGDGHGETYNLSGGVYDPQAGVYNTLVANSDGTFALTQKNQTQYIFSITGKLTAVQDKNGNTVNLMYDGSGNLTMITGGGGRTLTLAYDSSGRIVTVTDPMGHVESYSYDAANDLVSATDPLGGVTKYAYDGSHHVTQITLPNGNTLASKRLRLRKAGLHDLTDEWTRVHVAVCVQHPDKRPDNDHGRARQCHDSRLR